MIIYKNHCAINLTDSTNAGVVGDNLSNTQEFLIQDLFDKKMTFSLHLRFADNSVNSIILDNVVVTDEGTKLIWVVKKNDIFTHGFFELQINGCSADDVVYQTQIVTLFADESIAIEDKEYLNPNSETLKLRQQTFEMLNQINEQNTTIESNKKIIESYNLSLKEDNNNKISDIRNITSNSKNYPSIAFLKDYFYDANEVEDLLLDKYDKSNIETGSGTLVPYDSSTDKIKTATYEYIKISNYCICNFNVVMCGIDNYKSYIHFVTLPFKNLGLAQYVFANSSLGKQVRVALSGNSTWSNIYRDSGNYTENEIITASIIYRI